MILAIIIIILIMVIYLNQPEKPKSVEEYLRSSLDHNSYKVLIGYHNAKDAANLLAKINRANIALIEYMRNKYSVQPTHQGYILAERLKKRYMPDRLKENQPSDPSNTSYTEDKGAVLALCLREKQTSDENLEDYNTLIFVSAHELAHIASVEYGHSASEFWRNFKFILNEAVQSGLYKAIDYSRQPINYCGLDVNYSPLYDASL